MKKLLLLNCALCILNCTLYFPQSAFSQDTIHVQAFTFANSQDSTIVFPSDTVGIERIIMNYTLRCPYTVQCGEWDYLTYTFLYKPTGAYDSVSHTVPNYIVNGTSPDSFPYINTSSYSYYPHFEQYINYSSVISFDSAIVGAGSLSSWSPFNTTLSANRTQYLWTAAELISSGLIAGNITNLRFNIISANNEMQNLTIRMKLSSLDSLTVAAHETTGFTSVYQRNTSFGSGTGWQGIDFTYPFSWDGVSNIAVDIGFNNPSPSSPNDVRADMNSWMSGVTSENEDRSRFFTGTDYVEVPSSAVASLDSFITISFWAKGDPALMPANVSAIEAVDSLNQRVFNIHMPWSDEKVYWDAGNSGTNSYDRISKVALAADYKFKWTNWTFVKNLSTARMKIYKDGVIFLQGVNLRKTMSGIRKLRIGAGANNNYYYRGNLDDVAIFNAEVDQATVQQWMYKKIDASHPFYSNLILYYPFDDVSNTIADDASTNNIDGAFFGIPATDTYHADTVFKNLENTTFRPQIIFGQGVYTSTIDSILIVDSLANAPVTVFYFGDTLNPTVITDTLFAWETYYNNYIYNSSGIATDSALVAPDSTLYLNTTTYFDPPFAVNDRYELGRFITPYGNSLSLGNNGFKWKFDVSDYRTLLHDSVHLAAGNWQELLDLSFDMIKGTPPRNILGVKNLWNKQVWHNSSTEATYLPEQRVFIPLSALNSRVKLRLTGHGADNNNCSEFCVQSCYLYVDSALRFSKAIWRDDCSLNPLYPQGGTWVYPRANWCPGAEVETYDVELTPYATPGDSVLLNLNLSAYNGSGGANFITESQLITYGAPNFSLDAAVYEIKSPNNAQLYQRMNPICNNPLITIKNTGSTTLTSITITYGLIGGTPSTYQWTGTLAFMQSTDVPLGNFLFNSATEIFYATVSNPNGGADQYANNNTATSTFSFPPQYASQLIFELKTNKRPAENFYDINDDQGNNLLHKGGLTQNITYDDTVNFSPGCYEFRLHDSGEDGLTWWADTAAGSGYMRIKRASDGAVLVNFNSDFGQEIYKQFTIDYVLSTNNIAAINDVMVFPNPSDGKFNFELMFDKSQDALIEIYDMTGRNIYSTKANQVINKIVTIDLSQQPAGIYFAKVKSDSGSWEKKITLMH